ncbi:hypothetical protein HH214_08785 [Mucilaginibacter robiniae]|uniref:RteC protein n=1 Tax=Mucilaginibacter robiniae TaxID=2728022 RepID=A0A7L5E2U8_9SPHI|nr:RteC domain-containing protein [Mucilaginibacter robiniae]QJD95964.1 hypothetical protein HH214_08785 [Mucilaginibacter robiniae]
MDARMQQLIDDLRTDLVAHQDKSGLDRLRSVLARTEQAVKELRQLAAVYKEDPVQLIQLLKFVRPEIESYGIEEGLLYHLISNQPIATPGLQIRYYEEELTALQATLRLHAFYYQYYKNGFSELDELYFLPGNYRLSLPVPDVPLTENDSTPVSYLFARFRAIERLQRFIAEEISRLERQDLYGVNVRVNHGASLKWTGELVNVVELAYGIWLTGQLNNGNASLNQIVRWLEGSLDVSLGIIQRKFTEIQRRKRYSVTKYLDRMKKAIIQKIEEENE